MRIRKPKLKKGNERKLKRKGKKKENKEMRFHRKYRVISTQAVSPKSSKGPAPSAFFFPSKTRERSNTAHLKLK